MQTSVIRGTRLAVKYMSKNKSETAQPEVETPIILNTASATAFLDCYMLPEYAATKAGIVSFVRSLGTERLLETNGVRIVALCPGYTPDTKLFGELSAEYKKTEQEFVKDVKQQT